MYYGSVVRKSLNGVTGGATMVAMVASGEGALKLLYNQ